MSRFSELKTLIAEAMRDPRDEWLGVPCSRRPPTKMHRAAVWENMLGTVWAMNDQYDVKYFDYDHERAIEFAGALEPDRDPRLARCTQPFQDGPRRGQTCLFVKKRLTPEQLKRVADARRDRAAFTRAWNRGEIPRGL